MGYGEGYPAPQLTMGSGGASWAPPAQAENDFGAFWGRQNGSRCHACYWNDLSFSNNIWLSSLRRTGMVFLGTEVPVWFIPVQRSAGMAYHLISSHFEHRFHMLQSSQINCAMSYRLIHISEWKGVQKLNKSTSQMTTDDWTSSRSSSNLKQWLVRAMVLTNKTVIVKMHHNGVHSVVLRKNLASAKTVKTELNANLDLLGFCHVITYKKCQKVH